MTPAACLRATLLLAPLLCAAEPLADPLAEANSPEVWRRELRIIDVHQHIEGLPQRYDRAVGILERAGVGLGLDLGTGTVTRRDGRPSDFERIKALIDERHPGRFMHSMLLDYAGWDDPDWPEKAAAQVEEGRRLGAAGLKEFKRLGLVLRDGKGNLIAIDDPKLDAVWHKCGECDMPVSIHVADPRAFWEPFEESNERWNELRDHRSWWFGDAAKFPPRMALLEALDRVIARHPETTFVCVHFANNAEDIEWVDAALDRHPNMYADVAARIPEMGRHDPATLRRLFEKHRDRILFATDFMVYSRLILGSGGDQERPTDDDAVTFYRKCWRFFETDDRDWPHMTPIQGDWTIDSIGLPPAVCRKVYFDNARRLFARSIPLPSVEAAFTARDFAPDGDPGDPEWQAAKPARLEYRSADSVAMPEVSTRLRALWSNEFLYLMFECPFTELTVFDPPQREERIGLWDRDVVEAFVCTDPEHPARYSEYQVAPTGEMLDLRLELPDRDFAWSSGMQSAVSVDDAARVWRAEVRIPLASLGGIAPADGVRWRANFFRHDVSRRAGLALSPSLQGTFHVPGRFGWLVFRGAR